ncbi:hypothetical protein RhiirA1_463560 [Rhizophagus irregularis]|uniref:Uncharacterized protein n=1 Tax=Rhizophagus irregularis TaxID=588596 RepID=A0A2N0RJY4_9GLOM|nr:hypothetical protein RhiirA1_463560 [Rhizophagus irregularis]
MKKKAFEWYTKSAISGIEAQLNIGIYYNYGKGVDKNEPKASEWFLKSAEATHNGIKEAKVKLNNILSNKN